MNITKAQIKNYKSIEQLEIKFDAGLNILVGKNGSGKTAIIEAINILIYQQTEDKSPSEILIELEVTENELKEICQIFNSSDQNFNSLLQKTVEKTIEISYKEKLGDKTLNFLFKSGGITLETKQNHSDKIEIWDKNTSETKNMEFK